MSKCLVMSTLMFDVIYDPKKSLSKRFRNTVETRLFLREKSLLDGLFNPKGIRFAEDFLLGGVNVPVVRYISLRCVIFFEKDLSDISEQTWL